MTPPPMDFRVLGLPAPQGSKTKMPNGAMIEGSSTSGRMALAVWRASVAEVAAEMVLAYGTFRNVPVHVQMDFRFTMPKGRSKAIKVAGICFKEGLPDLDKLERSTLDGLAAGGLISNDSRFVHNESRKFELYQGWLGVHISLRPATLPSRASLDDPFG